MSKRAFTPFSRTSYAAPVDTFESWYGHAGAEVYSDTTPGGDGSPATAAADAGVAIVGGGAAAVAAIVAWQQHPRGQRPALLWIAAPEANGSGVAYQTSDPQHRLNVRARRMSVLESEPDDFVEYLAVRDGSADTEAFYPRADYGSYLHARLRAALEEEDCEAWGTEVIGAHGHADGSWELLGADGQRRRVHALVLAPGAMPPRCLRGIAPELVDRGSYRVDPWQFTRAAGDLPRRPDVIIIGSGLTAVDLALTAAHRYPDARIHMLSRHGLLPATQTRAGPLPPGETASLLARMEAQPRLCAWLREIRAAMLAAPDWRSVMESLRHETTHLWQALAVPERARFLRHLRTWWDSARHRMAPEIDAQLRRLMAEGRLQICAGRLLSARAADAGAVVIAWQPRGSEITRLQRAELVLQACGLETRIGAAASPLIGSLIEHGHARADALGLGLSVDSDNALVDARGHTHSAWLLGALARGSLWECTAIPDIREQAARVIDAVCSRAGHVGRCGRSAHGSVFARS